MNELTHQQIFMLTEQRKADMVESATMRVIGGDDDCAWSSRPKAMRDVIREAARYGVVCRLIVGMKEAFTSDTIIAAVERFLPEGAVYTHNEPDTGVEWPRCDVWLTEQAEPESVMHEVMHAVDSKVWGHSPNDSEEADFLALEAEACRRLRLKWAEWMESYSLESKDWGLASTRERGRAFADSRVRCFDAGLMDGVGRSARPTYRIVAAKERKA